MKYFAYGSNMDKKRMRDRGLNFTSREFGRLDGYKLMFNKKSQVGAAANIVPSINDYIEGVLYDFPDNEIENLDNAEGFPKHYDRIQVTVLNSESVPIKATTYMAQSEYIEDGLKPNKEYLKHLLAGKDILSKEYFDKLKATPTCD
ncbi:MAG: gamma-glutamylcyclotransferase family protein [Acholeplasma sp.]|nr:gamma-glutamylcyclotransferase family protein [Acholeplasma sp.]